MIGIDLGGTFIKAAAFTPAGKLVRREKIPTPPPSRAVETMANLVRELSPGKLSKVGVGLPGVLDRKRGELIRAPNLPGWEKLSLRKSLAKELRCPVRLENDANCAALGELFAGASQGEKNFLLITLGTGVGGGLVLDGKLWNGSGGMAGEFGHMSINPIGKLCPCGARGCIEIYANGKMIQKFPAIAARALGCGIASVVQLLDIRFFVLAGGGADYIPKLLPKIRKEMSPRIYGRKVQEIKIVRSQLGSWAGAYGAFQL